MNEPRAVEIIHEQSATQNDFSVKGYWDGELKQGGFKTIAEATLWAKDNGLIVCTRPQKREAKNQ